VVQLVELKPGPVPEESLRLLRDRAVYFPAGQPALGAAVRAHGVDAQPAPPEGLADDAVLLVGTAGALYDLVHVVDRLLGPGGCPWDQAQTHESLKKYLLEEAYEVLDAIDSGDADTLCEELGDLILQPMMHAQMRKMAGGFDIDDVAQAIAEKLIRRHPHVFGELDVADADEVLKNWDRIKQTEKGDAPRSILAGVPKGMASLLRAHEVSKRVVRHGFEWPGIDAVFEKLREEEAELKEALAGEDPQQIESEVGDLLFTAVNIARWAKVEPEEALRKMLNRFTARFQEMERLADKELNDLSSEEWDELWETAKSAVG
jgi:tetrapyrrole methylase family protein/MazG family protein